MDSQRQLHPNEPLSRFLTSKGHFSRQQNRVKHVALLPPSDGKLSVFRTENLTEVEVWKLGEVHVVSGAEGDRRLYGRADMFVALVREVGLEIDADNNPPRHANVIGWPQEKADRKLRALQLAERASLRLRDLDTESQHGNLEE